MQLVEAVLTVVRMVPIILIVVKMEAKGSIAAQMDKMFLDVQHQQEQLQQQEQHQYQLICHLLKNKL